MSAYRPTEECLSCGEGDPVNECPKAERACGHHCNHIWTSDQCCWCGLEEGELVMERNSPPLISGARKIEA